jgi:hypothetical protein
MACAVRTASPSSPEADMPSRAVSPFALAAQVSSRGVKGRQTDLPHGPRGLDGQVSEVDDGEEVSRCSLYEIEPFWMAA